MLLDESPEMLQRSGILFWVIQISHELLGLTQLRCVLFQLCGIRFLQRLLGNDLVLNTRHAPV